MTVLSSFVTTALTLATATLLTAGCVKTASQEHIGMLEAGDKLMDGDKSYYDEFELKLRAKTKVEITLISEDFDTYVIVSPPDSSPQRDNDDCDDNDPARGSCLSFVTHTAGVYTVVANSYAAGETGRYQLRISTSPAK